MPRLARTVLVVMMLLGGAARAEVFVDLRAGASFTDENDVELSAAGGSIEFESEYEDSATVGGRAGYWFESAPWVGLAIDASYFSPDAEDGGPDLDVIPVSPLLMLRLPLAADDAYPRGRLQPFLGVGPGIFITVLEDDSGYEDTPADVGLDLHAGVRFMVSHAVGLFVQYRFTSYEAQASDDVFGFSLDTDLELDTHHVAGGVGFTF